MSGVEIVLAGISAAASIAGGVTSYMAGQSTARNEKLNAQEAEAAGEANARRVRREMAQRQAAFRAEGFGASGVTASTASSGMEAYIEMVKQGEITALDEIMKGKMQKQTALQQMRNAQAAGTSGAIQGIGQAAGTLGSAYARSTPTTPPKKTIT